MGYSPWGHRESGTTEWLNNNNSNSTNGQAWKKTISKMVNKNTARWVLFPLVLVTEKLRVKFK